MIAKNRPVVLVVVSQEMYVILGAILLFAGWRFWRSYVVRQKVLHLAGQDVLFVDVRSPSEYKAASNPKSINIPLDIFSTKIATLNPEKTIVLCCASGVRSGAAVLMLKKAGFKNMLNAGAWQNTLVI